jgi:vacuolar-type H+-ATPase subunit I/STV1
VAITKSKGKLTTTQASTRKKLLSELEDAQNSLQFFQTSVLYTDETREPLIQQVNTKIAELQQQLSK